MKPLQFFLTLIVVLLLGSSDIFAFTIGKAHVISSLGEVNKSIMVKNSSLDRNAEVVNWSNTGVNSQCWIITSHQDESYQLTNVYSGKILYRRGGAVAGSEIVQFDKNDLSAGKWNIEAVEGEEGYFYITQSEPKLYLEVAHTGEGALLHLQTKKEGSEANNQKWKFYEVDERTNSLTRGVQELMMQKWKERYYRKAPTGYVLGNGGWWGDAEMFEVVLDAYETTGNPIYEETFRQLHANFIVRNGSDWLYNDFNDDIAWMVLVSVRAYLLFGDQVFLTNAKSNFDRMYARAMLPSGMLRWKEGVSTQNGTNSCINGPAEVAACYLAIATGDENYYNTAIDLYALQRQYLFVPTTGQVYDSFTWTNGVPSNYNYWASTYNQGTFLGAAVMLYNHSGNVQYKEDAKMIMDYTFKNLCNEHGIIQVCQVATGDLAGFKGILMRYVRRFIVDLGQTEYVEMMQKNALHAFNNQNSQGVSSSAWLTKSPENFIFEDCTNDCSFAIDPFGPSTAVSAAFNAPLNAELIFKNGFSQINANNFDYVKGVHVETGLDGSFSSLVNVKTGYYTGYNNIVFGNNLASRIKVRVSKAVTRGTNIEIRLGSPLGRIIGTVVVPREGEDWQTVTAEIEPLDGMHNIYFIFNGIEGVDLLKLDYFLFEADHFIYPDITDNGGELSTSHHQSPGDSDISGLIDNRLSTKVSVSISDNPNASWILYASETPVTLKGYSLGAANDAPDKDPKSWKLQGSDNGLDWTDIDLQTSQNFNVRNQLRKYDLPSVSNSFSFFKLFITETNGNTDEFHLSEWQLYGDGLFENDITADGGLLTAEFLGNETEETYVNLIDKKVDSKYLVFDKFDLWVDYKANGIYQLSSYSLTSSNDSPDRDPKDWVLYGSNNGSSWTLIDQQKDQKFLYREITQTYRCENVDAFQYFKLHITANNGSSLTQFSEFQLFGSLYFDPFFSDVTSNGGELSSSQNEAHDSDNLLKISDNNGESFFSLDAFESTPWIQYKSTIPVQLRAYSITVAKDETKFPASWRLEGSNDGHQWNLIHARSNIAFSLKGEQKAYPVSSNSEYEYFRLTITRMADVSSKEIEIAELELHGTGISDYDLTSNGGTIMAEYAGVANHEGEDKLIDNLTTTKYCGHFQASSWFEYFSPTPIKVLAYSITSANDDESRDPKDWDLEASNDGFNWTKIDGRRDQKFPYRHVTQYYGCNIDDKSYTYYRLRIKNNHGSNLLQLSQWQLLDIQGAGGVVGSRVPKFESLSDVNIYPNPARDLLHIGLKEDARVDIYTIAGQLVHSMLATQGDNLLHLGSFKKGAYLVKISTARSSTTKKLLKW